MKTGNLTESQIQEMNDEFEMNSKNNGGNVIDDNQNGEPEKEDQAKTGVTLFNQNNGVQKSNSPLPLATVDLNNGELPDLDDADIVPLDLASNYWSPVNPGENKRVYFDKIEVMQVQDNQDKEVVIDLPCAFFFEKSKGQVKTYCNGSKRLVAIIERNHMERGTPILITYMGKKKNSTNSFLSDDWSVKPLILKIS